MKSGNTILEPWEEEYYERHPKPIDIKDCHEGDLISFTLSSGNRYEGIIESIKAVVDNRYTKTKDYYVGVERLRGMGNIKTLYSNMRIERITPRTNPKPDLTNTNKYYYLLCK